MLKNGKRRYCWWVHSIINWSARLRRLSIERARVRILFDAVSKLGHCRSLHYCPISFSYTNEYPLESICRGIKCTLRRLVVDASQSQRRVGISFDICQEVIGKALWVAYNGLDILHSKPTSKPAVTWKDGDDYLYYNKLQVAILARSSREMSQTVRIDWKHTLSRVRVSVRPTVLFFITKKHLKLSRIQERKKQRSAIHRHWNRRKGGVNYVTVGRTDPSISDNGGGRGARARVCVRECVRVCARVCAYVRACVRVWVRDVFAICDNNIWPRLIMRIIKILFL